MFWAVPVQECRAYRLPETMIRHSHSTTPYFSYGGIRMKMWILYVMDHMYIGEELEKKSVYVLFVYKCKLPPQTRHNRMT